MLRITLSLLIMMTLNTPTQPPATYPLYDFGEGTAYNFTARRSGELKMHLKSADRENFKAVLKWDNQKLFGTATACGSHTWKSDDFIDIQFEGLFDCSAVGGWPENTSSVFTADVRYFVKENAVEGTYVIKGAGVLPYQHGALKVRLGKASFDLGPIGEFPCNEPELDTVP